LRQGFGTNLIEKGLPGAKVQLAFNPDGVECTIVVPVPQARNSGAPGKPEPLQG
jgi:hypothetical protein